MPNQDVGLHEFAQGIDLKLATLGGRAFDDDVPDGGAEPLPPP
ncbi:MAG: hypothetical protein DIU60_015590 [Actinomycetes bacterium]